MSPLDPRRKKEISKVMVGTIGAAAGLMIVGNLIGQHLGAHPEDARSRWLAAVPIVLILLLMVLALRGFGKMDELERKMHTEALAAAFLGSFLLVSIYMFLVVAELIIPPIYWLPPAMMGCYLIGLVLAVERYH